MTSPPYIVLGCAPKFRFMQVCNIDKNEQTKRVIHSRVYSNYMQYNMYTSIQITTTKE